MPNVFGHLSHSWALAPHPLDTMQRAAGLRPRFAARSRPQGAAFENPLGEAYRHDPTQRQDRCSCLHGKDSLLNNNPTCSVPNCGARATFAVHLIDHYAGATPGTFDDYDERDTLPAPTSAIFTRARTRPVRASLPSARAGSGGAIRLLTGTEHPDAARIADCASEREAAQCR